MTDDLQVITREELELERVEFQVHYNNVFCEMKKPCTRAGEYERCYTDLDCFCPFYRTYMEQENIGRLESLENGGGFDNSHRHGV